MEAFRTYTPMDPEAPESKAAVIVAFVNQCAADIKGEKFAGLAGSS